MTNNSKIDFQVININPAPIGKFSLPIEKHLEFKEHINAIFKTAPNELRQNHQEISMEHICNTSDQNIFNSFSNLKELKNIISQMIVLYIKSIGYITEEVVIHDAWLNNAGKNATLVHHYHPNSYISGNYFVNYNKESHSTLFFRNDRVHQHDAPSIKIQENLNEPTMYNLPSIGLEAEEGEIYLWHSHMTHGFDIPNKESNRITLSFNSLPKVCIHDRYSFEVKG